MSAANNAAKKRRAGIIVETPQQVQQPAPQPSGLTIYQVVALFDKRLTTLEKSFSEESAIPSVPTSIDHEEFSSRFDILAQEIDSLKQTVMALQTYTMSVTKLLLESNDKFEKIVPEELAPAEE